MKLSELVNLRNELQQVHTSIAKSAVYDLDSHLSRVHELPLHLDYKSNVSDLINIIDSLENNISTIDSDVQSLIEKINAEIEDKAKDFLSRGYLINGVVGSDSVSVEFNRACRVMPMHSETKAEVLVKARKYTDWRYPVLEIGPGDGIWTEHLIAGDPLYLVDIHSEFLESTLNKFNPVYRNRIRPYLIGCDGRDDTDLSMLPQGQFSFIFSWNVFDYFPLAHIKSYLKQAMSILRPGGVMMFSYNNCDVRQCAAFAEQGVKSWMPKSLLVKTCKEEGFEIINLRSLEETVHWIEIKKPGELKTVKAHQVLGEIVHI